MLRAEKDQTRPWRQLVDGLDQIFRPGHGSAVRRSLRLLESVVSTLSVLCGIRCYRETNSLLLATEFNK